MSGAGRLLLGSLAVWLAGCSTGSATPSATPFPPGYPPPLAATLTPAAYPGPEAGRGPEQVIFRDFEIVPAELSVPAGIAVAFRVESASGAEHWPFSLEPAGLFDAGAGLEPGQAYAFTFRDPGSVKIGCRNHPEMYAVIVVTP